MKQMHKLLRRGKYLRNHMTVSSQIRWAAQRIIKKHLGVSIDPTAKVKLKNGPTLYIREGTDDANTAHEVFVAKQYNRRSLPFVQSGVVVDIGANVGYAVLDFCSRWPRCRVLAFEPIPAHLEMIKRHVKANNLEDRVEVVAAAVGTSSGRTKISINGVRSHITTEVNGATSIDGSCEEPRKEIDVDIVDVLERLKQIGEIELIKLDIEGYEFPILLDERFKELDVRFLVVEWHPVSGVNDPQQHCANLLIDAGYTILEHVDNGPVGLFYCRGR